MWLCLSSGNCPVCCIRVGSFSGQSSFSPSSTASSKNSIVHSKSNRENTGLGGCWRGGIPDMTSPSPTTSFPIGCGEGLEIVKLIEGPTCSVSRESLKMSLVPAWAQQASFLMQSRVLCFGTGELVLFCHMYVWALWWEGGIGNYFLICGISRVPNRSR